MALALRLARRGLGRVWPNPAVGCIITDSQGHIAGRGWTQDGGRPHAETQALAQAGERARGGTAVVSLEPCSHHGKTGPCADALIAAGVTRVVSATGDPDPRVSGSGHARLKAAGIEVRTGVRAGEAARLNEGFMRRVREGRPSVTLKLASTIDSRIALPSGESRWITGTRAREHVHLMRSQHDGVLVGVGTVLKDDPELTCRLPGFSRPPTVRIVLDSQARLPVRSKLAASARIEPVWLLAATHAEPARTGALAALGVRVFSVPEADGGLDLAAALAVLGGEGLTRILAEGGAAIAASLLKLNLADVLLWYRAPSLMGEGVPAVASLGISALSGMARFSREGTISLGEDVLETYRRAT
jgi:diaminohydroxyphosphoribosylaminopyrimidine deaminase/5-amino-6-(5-phosphoribosylamino)uracil reductase